MCGMRALFKMQLEKALSTNIRPNEKRAPQNGEAPFTILEAGIQFPKLSTPAPAKNQWVLVLLCRIPITQPHFYFLIACIYQVFKFIYIT